MFMNRKLKSAKGFTLAELLIVVAIIGVLVAIAIPIFTSQLERSREAVDLSDVRSAYAEVMMAAITGDTSAKYTKDSSQTIWKSDGTYSIKVTPLKQQRDGWQTPLPITIGGVSSNDAAHWIGTPGANGYCEIIYCPPSGGNAESVKFEWSGGSSGDSGNAGGNSGSGENPGGGSGDSTGGNAGESTGGDSGGGSTNPDTKLPDSFNSSVIDWDKEVKNKSAYTIGPGVVYSWNGDIYFGACTYSMNSWEVENRTPDYFNNCFAVSKYTGKIFSISDFSSQRTDVNRGDICKVGEDYYFYKDGGHITDGPLSSGSAHQWIKILIQ